MATSHLPEAMLNEREAAAVVGLTPDTLRNDRSRKRMNIPYFKLGTSRRSVVKYRYSDLLAWLETKRVPTKENENGNT